VGLDPNFLTCDVWAFRDAVEGRRYQEALDLYSGPLLPGFHANDDGEFERWLEEERETLREAAADAAWALAHQRIRSGALVEAERTAQRALGLVWSDETPVRDFIAALAAAGERAAAVRFYDRFRARLREELDVEPSVPTVEVAEAVRNGREWEQPDAPGMHSGDGQRGTVTEPSQESPSGQDGGASPHRSGPSLDGVRRTGPRVWWLAAGAVVAGLVLASLPSLGGGPSLGPPPPDRPYAVLADVAGSADREERKAVAFLLRTGLDVSHVVQTVPSPDVHQTLSLMERPEVSFLDGPTAREVGIRLGIPNVVVPRLDHLGDTYSLALRVEDAASGHFRTAVQGRVGDVAGVVALADSLVLELRRRLGEAREVVTQSRPLPQVLTPSLEALREYERAEALGPGRALEAMIHLRRAVVADTAFAMVWQLMASLYANFLNEPDSADMARRQVARFWDRLSEARQWDLLLHQRMKEDVALWDVALEEAERAVIRDPRYLNNYAVYTAVPGGLPDSALNIRFRLEREGAEKARRFDPDRPYAARCFINTHYWAAALDRMDEWLSLLDSLNIELPPDCGREAALFESLAEGAWARVDGMVRDGPGDWRWPTAVEVALLQMTPLRGRIRAAHSVPALERSETRSFLPNSGAFGNIAHLLLQVAYDLSLEEAPEEPFGSRGRPGELEGRRRDEVTHFVINGVRESLLGDTLAAEGVVRRLRVLRDSSTSRTFEGAFGPWFALLEAGPAYQRGDWPGVIRILGPMATRIHDPQVGLSGGDDYLLWWVLAEAHAGSDDPRSAIRHLQAILERPRFRTVNWMLQGFIHPAARFKLARLCAQVGDLQAARDHYRVFLATFTDPDPEFRWMVEEARQASATPEG
jgi:tetratricopeptide (TPR) repeat protein